MGGKMSIEPGMCYGELIAKWYWNTNVGKRIWKCSCVHCGKPQFIEEHGLLECVSGICECASKSRTVKRKSDQCESADLGKESATRNTRYTSAAMRRLVEAAKGKKLSILPDRSRKVAELRLQGLSYREIAETLNMSYSCVVVHTNNAIRTLNGLGTKRQIYYANLYQGDISALTSMELRAICMAARGDTGKQAALLLGVTVEEYYKLLKSAKIKLAKQNIKAGQIYNEQNKFNT